MSLLIEANEKLRAFNEKMDAWLKSGEAQDLMVALRMYVSVREAHDELEATRKELGGMLERMNRDILPTMMDEKGVNTISLSDIGRRFSGSSRVSASIIDKPKGHAWLRANNAASLIQDTVNASTLSSFAKTHLADTGKDLPVEIFKVTTMRLISVTKL